MNTQTKLEPADEVSPPEDTLGVADELKKQPGLSWKKIAAFTIVPLLVLLAGAYFWIVASRYETTDNAYVQQNVISVAPLVSGQITEVAVRENQAVKAGDVLFRIDDTDYRIAVAKAEAELADARIKVSQLRSEVNARVADSGEKAADVALARENLARQSELLKRGFTTRAKYDEAVRQLNASQQTRISAEADVASARDALSAAGPGTHPLIKAAQAALDKARLDLERTVVRAPNDGVASQTDKLQVGQNAIASFPALSLVSHGETWIEANFKETQLRKMHIGQPAEVEIDAFGSRKYRAAISSVGVGTGSQFSVLPAQNATGNWVKVVQRVPVRLKLLETPEKPLVAGLSAKVTVDITR